MPTDEREQALINAFDAHVALPELREMYDIVCAKLLEAEARTEKLRAALERIADRQLHRPNPEGYWCDCAWCVALQALERPHPSGINRAALTASGDTE